jgi:hypothetical protein
VSERAANALAAGVRSFLSSLPYMAPETVELQARTKLAEPLAEYEVAAAVGDPVGNCLRHGLRAICTAGDGAPFTREYQGAGGGYEGLQAIARAALDKADEFAKTMDESAK